jgi:hypothetical protein
MRKNISCLILCAVAAWPRTASADGSAAPTGYDKAIDGYVQFLRQPRQTPVDYILGLFKTYDLVVLCERTHPETTQYDMICQLAADARFQQQVGHIFTECGSRTIRPALESFLMDDTLTDEQAREKLLEILRDFNWSVGWGRTNYYDFLKKVHDINRSLPPELRVHIYPCDMDIDWRKATKESYRQMRQQLDARDKIMADHISRTFDEIRSSAQRKKALVIMNYRHAFPHLKVGIGKLSKTFENTTGYLMAAYPGQVANVLINNVRILPGSTDNQAVIGAIHGGKWDAAFAAVGNPRLGFDFQGSPFGADRFDYFAVPFPIGGTYQNVFTGFVFFRPLDEHRMSFGVPGLVDAKYAEEMVRRYQITGENVAAEQIAKEKEQSQTIRTFGYENKELFPKSAYAEEIRRWQAAK